MPLQLLILPSAQREIDRLPDKPCRQVEAVILRLSTDPRPKGSKQLKGTLKGLRRVRVGDYRVLYVVEVSAVVVHKVGNRRDVYD